MAKTSLIVFLSLLLPLSLSAQFQPHVDYAVGPVPFSVAMGDFNGDGKVDFAVTSETLNVVSVMLGKGDGTFLPRVDYPTAARPTSVVVADFNGDEKLDLAVADGNAAAVSVLFGNGDGTFQPRADYAAQTNDQYLVAADFNGDGKLDLATTNYDPNTVSIFLNNGDGTFQAQRIYAAGVNPFGIVAGDFDSDGKVDLAVVNNNGWWGVQILIGNGDGSFQSPVWYAAGTNPRVGVVADFDGNGTLDLAIGNCISNDLSILFGDGNGHFAGPMNYAAGACPQAVAGGDVNLDGKLDLVVPNSISESVSVFLGNGDGTFQPRVDYAAGAGAISIAVGDLNGDGAPDAVTANRNADSISVLLNAFRGTTTSLTSLLNPAAPNQLVTYVASVKSKQGTETGTVTFKDGDASIATVALANHQATFTTRYSLAGVHTITAIYSGDDANTGSSSPTLTEYIQGASKTVVTTSGSPVFVGQQVTFTATVSSKFGTIPDGGLVTFYDGTQVLGTSQLARGTAVYSTAALAAKNHVIKAIYSGDPIFKPSSGAVIQVVNKYSTTTTLTSNPNPSRYGQTVTFSVQVTGAGPMPTGKVKFFDGTVGIGSAMLTGGIATLSKSKLSVGTHAISAQYLADPASDKSTSTIVNQVVQ